MLHKFIYRSERQLSPYVRIVEYTQRSDDSDWSSNRVVVFPASDTVRWHRNTYLRVSQRGIDPRRRGKQRGRWDFQFRRATIYAEQQQNLLDNQLDDEYAVSSR